MPNIVEIIVRATDMTGEGFGKAEAKATGLGATMTKFAAVGGLALAAVGVESVRMAAKFDSSMEMLATQAGVPQSKLASLKAGVLDLASKVGFSPDSLAESLYHVASNMESLGGKAATTQNMMNIVKIAAEGARTGGADLVDVTNALTAAVASGIPGVQNYSQAMGMLNATVGAGDMKMQDLAEAFGSGMVATVKGFGLSLKDVGAALAVFGDNNIRGAHAGTQLRMSVMALAAPTTYGKGLLMQWGEAQDQLSKDMRSGGLMKALDDLQVHFRKTGIGAKEQGEIITNMFGKKAGAGLNVLMDQMDRLRSKYPAITKGAANFGGAWQATLQQTSTVFAQLGAFFEALMISIGEKLLPVVKQFGQWMLNNKSAIEMTLGVIAALVAVLGTYVIVVKAVTIATEIWEAVQKLLNGEMEMNPIGLVITALALLVIGLIEAYKHSQAFRDIVHEAGVIAKEAFRWVLNAAKDVFDWIKGHWPLLLGILLGPVAFAVGEIIQHWRAVMRGADDAVHFIQRGWSLMENILTAPIKSAYDTIMGWFHDIENWLADLPGRIANAIPGGGVVGKVAGWLGLGTGGIVGAATGGVHGGLRLVGEYGPELVRMPQGSTVFPTGQSMGMLGDGGSGGGGTLQLELVGGYDDLLLRWLRQAIRIRGGNVQQVLGQGS